MDDRETSASAVSSAIVFLLLVAVLTALGVAATSHLGGGGDGRREIQGVRGVAGEESRRGGARDG